MTTILKPDGYYTSNLIETAQVILVHLITKDDPTDDTDYHKKNSEGDEVTKPNRGRQRIHPSRNQECN